MDRSAQLQCLAQCFSRNSHPELLNYTVHPSCKDGGKWIHQHRFKGKISHMNMEKLGALFKIPHQTWIYLEFGESEF